jgi:enediyne biosynthesis protein E4
MAVADVDGDGWLDLYFTTQLGRNRLYRNLGGNRFEDVTAQAGVGLTDQISVAASFADIDNDGLPDLFVTTVRHGNHSVPEPWWWPL